MNKLILIMGLLNIFGLSSCKKNIDQTNMYPYIITKDYLIEGIKEETVIGDTLGHDLYSTLVYDLNGLVQNIKRSELENAGISTKQAFDTAYNNLNKVLKAQKITIQRFNGPDSIPFIMFCNHWLSASIISLPEINEFAQQNLGTDSLFASIPHRDVLLIFPNCSGTKLENFKKMILEKESNGKKPLTFGLFRLGKNLTPLG
jgi:uncharacterized protein YtpQ (UPF0354 family)